jgi:polygalacturonase
MIAAVTSLVAMTSRTWSPEQFGAAADGRTDDTKAVRAAAAAMQSGDTLVFRGAYLSGPFNLTFLSDVTLRFEAASRLQALNKTAWPETGCLPNLAGIQSHSCSPFVRFSNVDGCTLTGGGTVDGAGDLWWKEHDKDPSARIFRPHLLEFNNVSRLTISRLSTHNPPNHHLRVNDCNRVRIERWSAYSPGAPNTDGVNFAGGRDQSVRDSVVWNGDDCVTAIASPSWPAAEDRATDLWHGGSLLVENVHCNHSHGISIGSVRHGVITNVTVRNVTITNGENGVRIKAYPNGTGEVSAIKYDQVAIHNVRNPIVIDGFYCPPTQRPYPCHAGATAVRMGDFER